MKTLLSPLSRFQRPLIAALSLLALCVGMSTSHAGKIYVPDYSFETPVTDYANPEIDSWQLPPQPVTFDTNVFGAWTNLVGEFFNAPPEYGNPYYISNGDGSQLAFLFSYPQLALFQDYNSIDYSSNPPTHAFNALYTVGKSYTLTVGLTTSSVEPLTQGATLDLSLYYRDAASNMVTIADTTVTYDTNVFTNNDLLIDFSVTVPAVTTNSPWAGKHIGIQFESTVAPQLIGGVWDLDNVRLEESVYVPDFSFETPVTDYANPEIDSWQLPPQPAGFDTNVFGAWTNLVGEFFNAPPQYGNPYYISNGDGSQLAFLFSYPQLALFQDYDSTDWSNTTPTHAFNSLYTVGKSYTLTVGLTTSSVEPLTQGATLDMSLYYRDAASNMVTIADTTVTYDTNVFTNNDLLIDFSATIPVVTSNSPFAGKHIGIQFESTVSPYLIGGVWDLDNVRLSETVATTLTAPARTNGQFGFTLLNEPGLSFEIQASTNVAPGYTNWTTLGSFINTSGTTPFVDTTTNLSQRFYRAHQL